MADDMLSASWEAAKAYSSMSKGMFPQQWCLIAEGSASHSQTLEAQINLQSKRNALLG